MTLLRLGRASLAAAALVAVLAASPRAFADDTSPFKDWKEVQKRGVSYAKERAQYWVEKGVTAGKDSLWVAKMWNYATEYAKALPMFEAYLTIPEMNPDNREAAYQGLVEGHGKLKQWEKVVEWAGKYRADMQQGKVIAESFDNEGRAERLLGHEDKAAAAFAAAAERKFRLGVTDGADIHLANGKVPEAKALVEKSIATLLGDKADDEKEKAKYKALYEYLAFLDVIGKPAPSFEKAASVGKTPAPTEWKGKPAVLLFWNMQTNGADRKLQWLEGLRRQWSGKANFVGISGYNHYNPQTSKVVPEMGEEEERDWYQKFIADSKYASPPCIVVPKDVLDAAYQKIDNQLTVIDADWNVRYFRLDNKPYDFECVNLLLEKLTGSKAGAAKDEPEPTLPPEKGGAAPGAGAGPELPPEDK